MAAVYPGGSTVPATVIIVVKHRAYLSVGQLIVIAGIAALLVCQWYVAVQY
jgi:hypothetical protein